MVNQSRAWSILPGPSALRAFASSFCLLNYTSSGHKVGCEAQRVYTSKRSHKRKVEKLNSVSSGGFLLSCQVYNWVLLLKCPTVFAAALCMETFKIIKAASLSISICKNTVPLKLDQIFVRDGTTKAWPPYLHNVGAGRENVLSWLESCNDTWAALCILCQA